MVGSGRSCGWPSASAFAASFATRHSAFGIPLSLSLTGRIWSDQAERVARPLASLHFLIRHSPLAIRHFHRPFFHWSDLVGSGRIRPDSTPIRSWSRNSSNMLYSKHLRFIKRALMCPRNHWPAGNARIAATNRVGTRSTASHFSPEKRVPHGFRAGWDWSSELIETQFRTGAARAFACSLRRPCPRPGKGAPARPPQAPRRGPPRRPRWTRICIAL